MSCQDNPRELFKKVQDIESKHERIRLEQWSPRTLDIDILYWEGVTHSDEILHLPHLELTRRAFFLDPLKDLAPRLKLSVDGKISTALELAREHPLHSLQFMAILNVTQDSFSPMAETLGPSTISKITLSK